MSVLRSLESKLAGLVEGTFSRAFKSEVRPVEIARKLAKEMDEHKVQSLSRVYAPNEYVVWLSPEDRKQFEGYEEELAARAVRLSARARSPRADHAPHPARDRVQDRRAAAARLVRHPGAPGAAAAARGRPAEPGRRGPHHGLLDRRPLPSRCASPIRGAAARACGSGAARAGRLRAAPCSAARATRRRARRPERLPPPRRDPPVGRIWIVNDLGSTNGIKVNGRRVEGPQSLKRGDVIELGTSPRDVRAGVDGWSSIPIAVGLKFGFLAVLYLFLFWVARSALKDLRRGTRRRYAGPSADYEDATGMYTASAPLGRERRRRAEAARAHRRGLSRRLRL